MADGDPTGLDLLEEFDGLAETRNALRRMAAKTDVLPTWAGIPMPLEDENLVVEERYPLAGVLNGAREKAHEKERAEHEHVVPRSAFFSTKWRRTIYTYEEDGKVRALIDSNHNTLEMAFRTASISCVWGIEQEAKAINLLGGLVRHHMFKSYMLTGMLVETSKRSGVTYIFRRLRPTVALRGTRFLAALCMHPIGYYENSWAGAMCPTDEVIAHLTLMRGDEPMYWRRANQHGRYRPEAGL